jgi:hypothetical protein
VPRVLDLDTPAAAWTKRRPAASQSARSRLRRSTANANPLVSTVGHFSSSAIWWGVGEDAAAQRLSRFSGSAHPICPKRPSRRSRLLISEATGRRRREGLTKPVARSFYPEGDNGMNGDDQIVRGEDFLAELDRRGAGGCPSCGYGGMVTFGLGGELEPLSLLTKSQIRGDSRQSIPMIRRCSARRSTPSPATTADSCLSGTARSAAVRKQRPGLSPDARANAVGRGRGHRRTVSSPALQLRPPHMP